MVELAVLTMIARILAQRLTVSYKLHSPWLNAQNTVELNSRHLLPFVWILQLNQNEPRIGPRSIFWDKIIPRRYCSHSFTSPVKLVIMTTIGICKPVSKFTKLTYLSENRHREYSACIISFASVCSEYSATTESSFCVQFLFFFLWNNRLKRRCVSLKCMFAYSDTKRTR